MDNQKKEGTKWEKKYSYVALDWVVFYFAAFKAPLAGHP
jgi:hypothetical protein